MTAEPTGGRVVDLTSRLPRRRPTGPVPAPDPAPDRRPDAEEPGPVPEPELITGRRRKLPTLPSGVGGVVLAAPVKCVCRIGRGIKAGGDRWTAWTAEPGHRVERYKRSAGWFFGGLVVCYLTQPFGIMVVAAVGLVAALVAGAPTEADEQKQASDGAADGTRPVPDADPTPVGPHPTGQPTPPPLPTDTPTDEEAEGPSRYSGPSMNIRITPAIITTHTLPTLLAQAGIIRPADRRLVRAEEPTRHPTGAVSAAAVLPPGLEAEDVLGQARAVASALGVGKMLVDLSADPTHAGRLELYVAADDPFTRSLPSPLVGRTDALSVWDRLPVGWDVRTEPVTLRLVDASMLIAGEPRAGKSVALGEVIAAFALDPATSLHLFDGKGAGDLAVWRPVAATYCKRGAEQLRTHLEWAVREMERRFDALEEDGRDTKLTPEIAADLGFGVSLLAVDETRYYMSDPKHGRAIAHLAVDLAARGPAAGMISAWATQYMDKTAIPPQLKGVCSLRWAFRTPDVVSSNLVLGPGAVGRGHDSSRIPRVSHRGVSILDADGDEPQMMRTHYLTPEELADIARTAQDLRSGRTPVPAPPVVSLEATARRVSAATLLQQALDALEEGEDRIHRDTLAARLEYDPDDLRDRLVTAGLCPVHPLRINGDPRGRGWYRHEIQTALEAVTEPDP